MKIAAVLFLVLSTAAAQAQVPENIDNISPQTISDKPSTSEMKTEAFVFVEEMPQFPGGQDALFKFIAQNLKYPKDAVEMDIQGKVYVRFIVEADGRVTNVNVVRGIHSSLDNEAVRVVNSMPEWKPGKQNGKDVRVQFTLPINFSLK